MEQSNEIAGSSHGWIGSYYPPKRKVNEEGIKYTNVFIMISTNYRPKNDQDYMSSARHLDMLLALAFDKDRMDEHVFDFVKNRRTGKDHTNDTWTSQYIKKVKARWGIEIGRKVRGQRLHVLVEVAHKSCIWVNRLKLQNFINENMAPKVKGSHVKVVPVPADMKYVLSYMNKDRDIETEELIDAMKSIHM
jgi:hypothetical protein